MNKDKNKNNIQLNYIETSKFFLQVVRFVIRAESKKINLPIKPDEVRWQDVFILAKKHYLVSAVYQYIKMFSSEIGQHLLDRWEKENSISIAADMEQLFAWDEIKNSCSDRGISLLPLKGIILKNLYPETYFRTMGDLDILTRVDEFDMVEKMMKELGYIFDDKNIEKHDKGFSRPLMTHVEMHSDLLPNRSPFHDYYAHIWEKATPCETSFIYNLSKEDEYIFLLIHAYKHFYNKGSGVRTIIDFYLFNKKYRESLNANYINKELENADLIASKHGAEYLLKDFKNQIDKIVGYWFNSKEIIIDGVGMRIISDGVYGKVENFWAKEINKLGKKKYLLKRLFPNLDFMRERYRILKKSPVLLPVFWIVRIFHGAFFRRKSVKNEFKYIIK